MGRGGVALIAAGWPAGVPGLSAGAIGCAVSGFAGMETGVPAVGFAGGSAGPVGVVVLVGVPESAQVTLAPSSRAIALRNLFFMANSISSVEDPSRCVC